MIIISKKIKLMYDYTKTGGPKCDVNALLRAYFGRPKPGPLFKYWLNFILEITPI